MPKSPARAASAWSPSLITVAEPALTVYLLAEFETSGRGLPVRRSTPGSRQWGIAWHLGVDGISLFLVVLTGVLFPLALLGGRPPTTTSRPYTAWMLLLEAGCIGAFLSLDLFLFFVFFEIVLVPMYFLIGGWGHGDRVYAAIKFFLFTMSGSAFMLVGILATVFLYAQRDRRPAHLRPRRDRAARQTIASHHGPMAVPRLRRRLRGEGAAVPAAHLAARRPHRGAHRRLGRSWPASC